jgi:hypothetical protein
MVDQLYLPDKGLVTDDAPEYRDADHPGPVAGKETAYAAGECRPLEELLQTDPRKPLDWRWHTALVLAGGPEPLLRKRADRPVLEAVRYVRALHACRDDADRARLAASMPDLAAAHRLRHEDPPHRRWAVEARVLADESPAGIAGKHGLTAGAVEAYEQCFFDVRRKLRATCYIMTVVVGPRVYTGLSDQDLDVIWKWQGYLYGPAALDQLIPLCTGPTWTAPVEDLDVLDASTRTLLNLKTMVALTWPADTPARQAAVLSVHHRLLQQEQAAARGAATDTTGAERVKLLTGFLSEWAAAEA